MLRREAPRPQPHASAPAWRERGQAATVGTAYSQHGQYFPAQSTPHTWLQARACAPPVRPHAGVGTEQACRGTALPRARARIEWPSSGRRSSALTAQSLDVRDVDNPPGHVGPGAHGGGWPRRCLPDRLGRASHMHAYTRRPCITYACICDARPHRVSTAPGHSHGPNPSSAHKALVCVAHTYA